MQGIARIAVACAAMAAYAALAPPVAPALAVARIAVVRGYAALFACLHSCRGLRWRIC